MSIDLCDGFDKVPSREPMFYILHGLVGNCALFWHESRSGYTPNVEMALLVPEQEARRICENRPKQDFAVPKDVVEKSAHTHVSISDIWESGWGK